MRTLAWIKGSMVCDGQMSAMGYYRGEESFPVETCLGGVYEFDERIMFALSAIIERLFAARCICPLVGTTRVIHFNNHPETTREDVDKVLRVYTEETEAEHYAGLLP